MKLKNYKIIGLSALSLSLLLPSATFAQENVDTMSTASERHYEELAAKKAQGLEYKKKHLEEESQRLEEKSEMLKNKSPKAAEKLHEKANRVQEKADLIEEKVKDKSKDLFTDVKSGDWYYQTVKELTEKNIINGYDDGSFKPNEKISYAEFFTLLNNTLGEAQKPGEKIWYAPTFKYLKDHGVIGDIEDPSASINRGEMAKYVSLALKHLKDLPLNKEVPDLKDYEKIASEYKDYVANVANHGFIVGDEHKNFQSEKYLTRAESSQVIKNLMEKFQ